MCEAHKAGHSDAEIDPSGPCDVTTSECPAVHDPVCVVMKDASGQVVDRQTFSNRCEAEKEEHPMSSDMPDQCEVAADCGPPSQFCGYHCVSGQCAMWCERRLQQSDAMDMKRERVSVPSGHSSEIRDGGACPEPCTEEY